MCRSTATRTVTVANPEGLHLRAAMLIAEVARRHQADVKMTKGLDCVDAKSVLQVMSLGAYEGEELLLEAEGPGAETVIEELAQLFARHFQHEQQHTEQE